jgi:integrator complex subunit 6
VVPQDADPYVLENFPLDKYELEQSPLTQYLATHKPGICWQCFMPGSRPNSQLGEPFGYLKASRQANSGNTVVNLIVLPYAYPRLWPLLDELANVHRNVVNSKWRHEFEKYLQSIPNYYWAPLKNGKLNERGWK